MFDIQKNDKDTPYNVEGKLSEVRGELQYWGLKNKNGEWMRFGNGAIFWTTSYRVATEQLKAGTIGGENEFEIAEF